MTNTPDPSHEPGQNPSEPSESTQNRRPRRLRWRQIGLFLGFLFLAGIGAGVAWTWIFVHRQLAPMVETSLEKLLSRPVRMGDVDRFTLNSLRFDAAQLPATPTDPDRGSAEAVEVAFNPVTLIFSRTLELDVTLVNPDLYLEQDEQRNWVSTRLRPQAKGAIDVKLQVLRVRNADVLLAPRSQEGKLQTPVALSVSSGQARFLENNQVIPFSLNGHLAVGGQLEIQGESRLQQQATNVMIAGNNLAATEVGRLLQLPLVLQAGQLDSNLEIQFRPKQPLKLLGSASLENVTARVPQLPQPFIKSNGQLRFKGTQVLLENVTTLFGQIPAVANGGLDTQADFNLSAITQPVALKQVLQTFKVKDLPIPLSGEVQTALQLTGPLAQPVVSGEVVTTKPTLVDRVTFRKVTAGFRLDTGKGNNGSIPLVIRNLRATPTFGGLLAGDGAVQLGQKQSVLFNTVAMNVPGDAIARTYNVKLPVPIGTVSARALIATSLDNPQQNLRAIGAANLNVAGGTVIAQNLRVTGQRFTTQILASGVQVNRLAQVPPQFSGPLSGNLTLSGSLASFSPSTLSGSGTASLNIAGGTITAQNLQLDNGRFTTQVQASAIQLGRLAQVPPQLQRPVSGTFNLSGSLASLTPSTIRGSGSGSLNVAGGTVSANNVLLENGRLQAQIQASGVQLAGLPQVPPQLNGSLSGNFNFFAPLDALSPSTIRGSGSGRLAVGEGTVTANNVELQNGRFTAQVQASGVQLAGLPQVPPQLRGSAVSGNFNLAGSLTAFTPASLQGSGSGRLNVAGGSVSANNVLLQNGRFTAQVQASSVQLARLAQVPPQLRDSLVSGNFNLSGSLANLTPAAISGIGSGRLNVAGGTVIARDLRLENGRFRGVVEPTDVQLAAFSQDLRGRLSGQLNVAGSLAALSPAAIQASGQLNFSEGLSIIDRTLTTTIAWNNQQLQIQQARAEGFNAEGVVNVNLANTGLQAIRSFNLNVRASDLNLQQIPATLPTEVAIAGRADFDGRIAGTPTAPNVNGNVQLRNFMVEGLAFEPVLSGTVQAEPGQGVDLRLLGQRDRIVVALDRNYQPVSFDIRNGEAVASGTRQGELLLVQTTNFPIDIIKELAPLPPAIATQPLDGRLSGNLTVNLNTRGIAGDIAIADPIFGTLRGESFTGRLQYANGVVSLTGGEFIQCAIDNNQNKLCDSRYLLSGQLIQSPTGPRFQAKLEVPQGQLQDLLTALQVFDLGDLGRGASVPTYNRAADLTVVPVGMPEAPLQTQLRRLSEIRTLLAQQREQRDAASPLPDISEAKGLVQGTVSVSGSLASGISAEFNIRGQNWQWGSYSAEMVIAEGNFQDGVLSLLPLRFQSGERYANFSGTIGGRAQSGQLTLVNIPIDELQAVLQEATNLPPTFIGFTGLLNANVQVSGSLDDPQARGVLSITDATLNRTEVRQAEGSFSYNDASLKFSSTVQLANAEAEPLNMEGRIPYKLPFASVASTDNRLNLNIDVHNEGLALLNLFTGGQVTWVDGKGDVELAVTGTVDPQTNRPSQLVANGSAIVNNATIQARALPESLTNVTGTVLFDFDRLQVQDGTAQFSDGTITAGGTLPISRPAPQENPLAVNIGELAINLKGLYSGRVQGGVTITGTALAPTIGGAVTLSNGQVPLAQGAGATTTGGGGTGGGDTDSGSPIKFNNLQLILGKGIQITQAPILNFLAEGELTVNGSLGSLRPRGEIELKRGQVNLFTTQFRLARGYDQTARFTPERGLDPILDVRLVAAVTETNQRRVPTDPLSAEISDALELGFVRAETVRIQAKVQGPASQLADNLELTSTPARSETEIVALLGGGFVETLGRGDSTLGLANLAGSALLGNVQNIIGDALGLTEFRLFPTIITNEEERSSTLGLAAEAGVDITRNFSVSVLKELTTNQPFDYSLRYRLNDDLLLRGATNFSGENRAVLEYERRF